MNIEEAQKDMRKAYTGGSTGVMASGLIWLLSGIVALISSQMAALLTLFFGGMMIFPIGLIFDKSLGRSGKHQRKNPLAKWAMAGTFLIFIGLYIAYMYYQKEASYFFPIMMITIGIRYLTFQYLYGMNIYLTLGATLLISGIICICFIHQFYLEALIGGCIEIVFAYIIYHTAKKIE